MSYVLPMKPNQSSGPYGVTADINSGVLPSYAANSTEVLTFVHELGHNFGSPHTHGCSWGPTNNLAIDDCSAQDDGPCGVVAPVTDAIRGTIMSYCNNANLNKGFGTEPGALIRNRYNAAMCIDVVCPATLTVNTATVNANQLASTSVTTSGTVAINGAAVFSSNVINLNAGFEVPTGNCFEANNVGCAYVGVLTCEGGGGGGGGPMADGTCNAPYVLTCGQVFNGNNATGQSNMDVNPANYAGPENIHTVVVPPGGITVTMSGRTADLDLFASIPCNVGGFIPAQANTEQTGNVDESIVLANATGGNITYHVIVDSWQGATSTYTLTCPAAAFKENDQPSREGF